ncbi:MAG TPA: GIY-YIG nuclease family protein [Ktedonobacterales bacterium]
MSSRREIAKEYKERRQQGGVYTITNTVNGKYVIGYAANLESVRNRFQFAVNAGSAVDPRLRADWLAQGAGAFNLVVVAELEQREGQIQAEFMRDLHVLEQLCRADLDPSLEY